MPDRPKPSPTSFHWTRNVLEHAYGNQQRLSALSPEIASVIARLAVLAAARLGVDPAEIEHRVGGWGEQGVFRVMQVNGVWTYGREVRRQRNGSRCLQLIDVLGTALHKPEPGAAFVSYLELVVTSVARDVRRTEVNRRNRLEKRAGPRPASPPRESPHWDSEWLCLVWSQLRPVEKDVLRMRICDGISEDGIAASLSRSRGQVAGIYRRAMGKLKLAAVAN